MDYIRTDENGQLVFEQSTEFLQIPSCLFGFHNTETIVGKAASGRTVYCFQGKLNLTENERRCEWSKVYPFFYKHKVLLPFLMVYRAFLRLREGKLQAEMKALKDAKLS